MNDLLKLHHVGIVVGDIEEYCSYQFLEQRSLIIEDPSQKALICFLNTKNDCLIELIQPTKEDSPTYNFLSQGGGYHHLCYEISSLEKVDLLITQYRMLKIMGPLPAVAFYGAEVVFCYTRNKDIIEFVISTTSPIIRWE